MDRAPPHDLVDDASAASCKSRSLAILSFALHVLINGRKQNGASWSFRCPLGTKELVILFPFCQNLATLEAVATVFHLPAGDGDTRVLGRHLCENAMSAAPPLEIALDEMGVLSGTHSN